MKENLTRMEQLKRQEDELKKEVREAKSKINNMSVYDVLDNRCELWSFSLSRISRFK